MTASVLANTPEPPYYAVIFTSQRTPADSAGYAETAERMLELAALQPGYLGVESARDEPGLGITVSYWEDLASIRAWRDQAEHRLAQHAGKTKWYTAFRLRICLVEREEVFPKSPDGRTKASHKT